MTGLWHLSWFPMQSNAVAGRQISCVHTHCVCVYTLMCLFVFADLEKLLYSLTARLQTVYRLVLAWSCMCMCWSCLTNPYINLIYYFRHFLKRPISYSPQTELFPKAGCALINFLGLVCLAVVFAVFSASYGHRATYLHIIQTREFILNGMHESIQQLLNDYHVGLKNRLLNEFTDCFIHFNQCHTSWTHSSY